jgi:hypothetical protein
MSTRTSGQPDTGELSADLRRAAAAKYPEGPEPTIATW